MPKLEPRMTVSLLYRYNRKYEKKMTMLFADRCIFLLLSNFYLWNFCSRELIQNVIKEGQIVPSEITIGLIRKAINSATSDKILIDGFPRCEENRIAFEKFVSLIL